MPAPSSTVQDALKSNCTFLLRDPVIKVTARDGAVAAYAPGTRYLTIGGVTYSPYFPVDVARPSAKVGLRPDSAEFSAPFDDVITKGGVVGGRWEGARAYTAFVVDQRDLSLGVVQERNWLVGKISLRGGGFTFELLSLSQALSQPIGEFTSPTDRNRTPEQLGINIATFTHAATVTAATAGNRRAFTTGVVQADVGGVPYFRYGRAVWATGANAGLSMEIEDNAAGVITLQLPMRSDIAVGDTLSLIAGYDGTREQARDKFGAADALNCEPDLPGMQKVLTYPK
jgi:uncharacterized phage protein (TIGR02218 family)